ncbi:MAG: M20/M25/M40 family metallo-hydrolase [Vicinamibacterales bacterium]
MPSRLLSVVLLSLAITACSSDRVNNAPASETRTAPANESAPETQGEVNGTAVDRIAKAAEGPSPLEANLTYLTTNIGGRISGSANMRKAVAWAQDVFRQSGVDDVHVERLQVPAAWTPGNASLTLLGASAFPVRLVSMAWAPPANLEGRIIDLHAGADTDFARAGAAVRGALLLVHTDVLKSPMEEYVGRPAVIERAVKAGAAAILWMSTREGSLLYRRDDSLTGVIDPIPAAILAREDTTRIAALLERGTPIRARLSLPNIVGGPIDDENVVAEIRGREKPDEVVVLGAHLDSWDLGTGALDDGVGVTAVMEAARLIHESGVRPRRTIRFVLFSGEEQGFFGSLAYVRTHAAELDRTVAAIVIDRFAGRTLGFDVEGRPELKAAVSDTLAPLTGWDATQLWFDPQVETDNFDFLLEGVPTLVAHQDQSADIVNYHASTDRLDRVDIATTRHTAAICAVAAYGIAERPEPLGKRLSRGELDDFMRANPDFVGAIKEGGIWEQWEKGQRGRH